MNNLTNIKDHLFVLPRGGAQFTRVFTRLDLSRLSEIEECQRLWPLENQKACTDIKTALLRNPQEEYWLACDTAFFSQLPNTARYYALPLPERETYQRCGADGLFHEWTANQYPKAQRLISIHLCEDTNVAAIRAGKAMDSTCGYSQLEGIPGMTSCGSIDPSLVAGIIPENASFAKANGVLYQKCGWQAIAPGISFAELCEGTTERARLPHRMLLDNLVESIGSMLAVLGGTDLIAIGCDSAKTVKPLTDELQVRFEFLHLPFEIREVEAEKILQDLLNTHFAA